MTPVEQIKSRLSTVDVVGSYLKLIRAGSNFKAVCPFHSEKSASFFVSPARDVWHCFGCGAGGDQFRFVMQIEGVDFREALRMLAERAGIELRVENPRERDERTHLFTLLECAAAFYQKQLASHSNVEAYLTGRGVTRESIEKFRLGYAPPESVGWRVFNEYALKQGYKPQELEKAGLAVKKQVSGYYDRFRNRIMFPITDANEHVVGFGARIYDDPQKKNNPENKEETAPAKYINTPQTPLYDKSAILYAFDKAKMAIRKENCCVIVEGYMDAIMAHQAGTAHTVAVSGTALTNRQLTLLRRLCDKISMSFDMDMAGELATRRSIDLALEMGFDVRALSLPSGKDPADLAAKDAAMWRSTVEGATDIISYFLAKAYGRHDSRTLEGKRAIVASVLPLVARLPREVDKAHWVGHIASHIGVREDAVWQDLGKESPRGNQGDIQKSQAAKPLREQTRTRILEERILGLLLTYGFSHVPALSEELFLSEDIKMLFFALRGAADVHEALANVPQEQLRTFANQLIFETEMLVAREGAEAEYASCMVELQRERMKEKLEQLTHDIRRAEEAGDAQQVSLLADEFSSLSHKFATIS
ncbi:MAG: DNA primase [Candidatus Ryanbacteria bacterium RIFCSPHIGHO2_02_FULL_45_17b]|uniref:DNA primase n=1 Tax=Candidatus Ryanbacteria bacterium RIFCSPHIGHO2_01_FULL_45_22 TaxID=1802114 RepID=A0A1G2FZQ6_9BACT|nr:MAG: DNA primase [Candidatus Ryanbacteria bacterium RIFCSPHIGHO2_01_FULL_45_22]OGZ47448.1 MAG: DNA primase [Candidatus Ryanbacteria bacterium RIFCSPHIGHO2_02_FULL_45_17b]